MAITRVTADTTAGVFEDLAATKNVRVPQNLRGTQRIGEIALQRCGHASHRLPAGGGTSARQTWSGRKNGAKVFVCDVDDKAIAAIAKEIPGLIVRRCDMASRPEIERMVPDAVAALGGLDVLINNAGIAGLT